MSAPATCWDRHERFRRSTADWRANTVPLLGRDGRPAVMRGEAGEPDVALANCRWGCGSTLGRELSR